MLKSISFKKALPRGFQKTLGRLRLTLICGLITFLVLRGQFGSILDSLEVGDGENSSQSFHHHELRHENKRSLAQLDEDFEEEVFQNERDPSVPYKLGPDVKNWDEQRVSWLKQNPQIITRMGISKPRILLVTGSQPKPCDNPRGDHYQLKSIKNKMDYCRLHDIDIFYNMAHLDQEMAGFWAKLPLIRKLMLAHPEVEWIWWMDSDAMFTDMLFELPMERYEDYSMVLHGWDEPVYTRKDWLGLNTGSFLLRNNQWSLDLLDIWAPMGPKGSDREEAGKMLTATLSGRPAFEADDQSALVYLLATRAGDLRPHVYLESSYYLHGFWGVIVERYEELMEKNHPGSGDDQWPFVTHFVGCKPCGSYGDYPVDRCLKQMERAFNFADNQILRQYGLQHRALSTHKVKSIRNVSSNPLEALKEAGLP